MPTDTARRVVGQLQRLALRETEALTDGQLLECFATQRDEAAFAALVRRHGPMVLGVCRRVAGHAQDAEDAFQATFLVLVRKAAGLHPRELVGHWLHGVAYRTALRARDSAARRRQHESQVPTMPPVEVPPTPVDDEWLPLLDRELQRLPEKYRAPVVLCDLEGRTRREVARQLKLPDGTLSNRLAAGRRLLARRLARHGVALSAGAVAASLLSESSAAVPTRLFLAAVKIAAEDTAPGAVPAAVTALSHGVLKAMLLQKLKVTASILIVLGVLGAATLASMPQSRAEPPASAVPSSDRQHLQGAWLMLAMATDGRMSSAAAIKDESKRWTFHGDKFLVTRA
ncbi:MAG: RNA polymerase sigma factor, partial [Gemmataceae bacterium]